MPKKTQCIYYNHNHHEAKRFFRNIPERLVDILNYHWLTSLSTQDTLDYIKKLKDDQGIEYSILLQEVYSYINSRHCINPYRYITKKFFFGQVHYVTISADLNAINCELKKLMDVNSKSEIHFTNNTNRFSYKTLTTIGLLLSSSLVINAENLNNQDCSVDLHDPLTGLLPKDFNTLSSENYFVGPFTVKNYTADDFYSRLIFDQSFQNRNKTELENIKNMIKKQFNVAKFLSQNKNFNHLDFVLSRAIRIKILPAPFFLDGIRLSGHYAHAGKFKLRMYLMVSDDPYERDQFHKVLIHESWHALMAFINDNCRCGLMSYDSCDSEEKNKYKLSPYDTTSENGYENFKKLLEKGNNRAANEFLKLIRANKNSPHEMTSENLSVLTKYENATKLYTPHYIILSNYSGAVDELEAKLNQNEVPLIPMPSYNNLGLFVYRINKSADDKNPTVAGFRVDKLEKKQLALIRDAEYLNLLVTGSENRNYTEEYIAYDQLTEKDAFFSEFGMPVISTFFKELHRHHNKRLEKYLNRCSHELNQNSAEDISLPTP